MAAILRNIVVVAMGAGALGGPDALRLLLAFAGWSPLIDIGIAVFVIAALTAPALGTMLLARFFRKAGVGPGARGGGTRSRSVAGAGGGATGAAAPADPFAKMTLAVSLAVAFIISASLLVVPMFQSGDLSPLTFAGVALAAGAIAARVRGVLLPNARGGAGAAPAAPATGRSMKWTLLASLAAIFLLLLLVPCVAVGMFDAPAQRLRLAFAFKNPLANVPVAVAAADVVGTTLLALFFCKAQNAAAERFHKMILVVITPLAVTFFLA